MYSTSELQTSWLTLNGWKSSYDSSYPALHTAITTSNSGLYYNDLLPGLTSVENIDAAGSNFDAMSASVYAAGTTYALGAIVKDSTGVLYISLSAANVGNTPSTSPTKWKSLLSEYIENLTRQGIVKLAGSVLNLKKLHNSGKALADDLRLFDGQGKVNTAVIGQSRFVGIEFQLRPFNSLRCSINKIGFQFSQIQSNLTIYLFHTSQAAAIKTYTLTSTRAGSMEWFTPAVAMDLHYFRSTTNDAGGSFYLGYFEDDITGQAISREIDFCQEPCKGCISDMYNRIAYEIRQRYMKVMPISFDAAYLTGTALPDAEGIAYHCSNNFGINVSMSVCCDFTELLINNKMLFAESLQMQVGVDVLNLLAFNTRNNGISEQLKSSAYVALKGEPASGVLGLEARLSAKIAGLEIDLTEIDAPCLARKSAGVKLGGI
jgi:hypothetical protein